METSEKMLPKKDCLNCDFFQKKELLTRNHHLLTKEYCQKFRQELFFHQACPKFRYNHDAELEVDTIYSTIGITSGMVGVVSLIALIISSVMKYNLAENILLAVTGLSVASLACFMMIHEKVREKLLYGAK